MPSSPVDAAPVKAEARRIGFDAVGVADARAPWEAGDRLREFVELGLHGDMEWMATTLERRAHPTGLWREARSAVMVGLNYGPAGDPLRVLEEPGAGAVSVYAQGADYHDVLKKRLKSLARWMAEHLSADVKVFVDTAPLMEKPLAERAGLGWRGKHTNLVSQEFGSWLFLGAVLTTADISPDPPGEDHCGSCRACLDICPTDAFPAPYQLDARRCVAYLTIEHRGPIPRDLRPGIGSRIYGCDDCLAVCPWNKFAQTSREAALFPRPVAVGPALKDLARLDDASFREVFAASPIKRTGRDRFVRNVLIAIGNSDDADLAGEAERLLDDASPLVRGAAVWALGRLLAPTPFAALRKDHLPKEMDPSVQEEWAAESAHPGAMGKASPEMRLTSRGVAKHSDTAGPET